MGEIEPASDDASLSTVLVHRADGLAHRPLERNQPTAGITPAIAGVLINRSKEPDAGPHVRFCEKHGGVILRAYSTSPGRDPRPSGNACRQELEPKDRGCMIGAISNWPISRSKNFAAQIKVFGPAAC